ncbi:hypothetical protein K502DRAFT_339952, partial [Neoconidiobolus thromboides FSU 785]
MGKAKKKAQAPQKNQNNNSNNNQKEALKPVKESTAFILIDEFKDEELGLNFKWEDKTSTTAKYGLDPATVLDELLAAMTIDPEANDLFDYIKDNRNLPKGKKDKILADIEENRKKGDEDINFTPLPVLEEGKRTTHFFYEMLSKTKGFATEVATEGEDYDNDNSDQLFVGTISHIASELNSIIENQPTYEDKYLAIYQICVETINEASKLEAELNEIKVKYDLCKKRTLEDKAEIANLLEKRAALDILVKQYENQNKELIEIKRKLEQEKDKKIPPTVYINELKKRIKTIWEFYTLRDKHVMAVKESRELQLIILREKFKAVKEAHENDLKELVQARANIKELKKTEEGLKSTIVDNHNKLKEMENTYNQQNMQISKLKEEYIQIKKKKDKSEADNKIYVERLNAANDKNIELEARREALEKESAIYKTRSENAEVIMKELKAKAVKAEKEAEFIRRHLAEFRKMKGIESPTSND